MSTEGVVYARSGFRSMRSLLFYGVAVTVVAITMATVGESCLAGKIPDDRGVENRPNVVLFLIDDLGCTDLGVYGSTFYDTPRMDELAQRSVRFRQFYSAHPVCSPTRAALMTGKAPQRVGITQWIPQPSDVHLPVEEFTIGEAFQQAGYRTGYIGKWHLGAEDAHMPGAQGFSFTLAVNRAGQPASYFFPFRREANRAQPRWWDVPNLEPGDYLTDLLTDGAIEFIDDCGDQPFFLCFAHYAVHTPIQAPEALRDRYAQRRRERFGETPTPQRDERFGATTRMRQDDPAYAAMVENLDWNVGRLLDHLSQRDLLDDTIIVFTSDNGGLSTLMNGRIGPTSCNPFRAGKGWVYEGGIRIPTMVSWKGHFPTRDVLTPGITMDLYPTLLECCGLDLRPEQHLDGVSLYPVLQSGVPSKDVTDRLLGWHYPHRHGSGHRPATAVRRGDWKLVHFQEDDEYELYNLQDDPGEQEERSQQHPEIVETLRNEMHQWLKQTDERR